MPISDQELRKLVEMSIPRLTVMGVGGAGCNTLAELSKRKIPGIKLISISTDAKELLKCKPDFKILIGKNVTKGSGTGNNVDAAYEAIRSDRPIIRKHLENTDMLFLTCGLGGGTGTAVTPEIARMVKKLGLLTIALVTFPFKTEGKRKTDIAMKGFEKLRRYVDVVMPVPNDKLVEKFGTLALTKAFRTIDKYLADSLMGIITLVTAPGIINVDFNDVKKVMKDKDVGLIGVGKARSLKIAFERALDNPLLKIDANVVDSVLVNVITEEDVAIKKIEEGIKKYVSDVFKNANIIWGHTFMEKGSKVVIVLTGIGY